MIRLLTSEDRDILQVISRETFIDTFGAENTLEDMKSYLEATYALERLEKELLSAEITYYFIYENEAIAGYLKLNQGSSQTEPVEDGLEIERIYIRKEFKRKGLGKMLVNFAIKQALINQKKTLWLGVWEHNEKALKFYEALEFSRFGEHVFWLGQDRQVDYLMGKAIVPSDC